MSINIRKLYICLPEWQVPRVRSALGTIMQEEGRLRNHLYYDGEWYDQRIVAIHRDDWKCGETFQEIVKGRERNRVGGGKEELASDEIPKKKPALRLHRWLPSKPGNSELMSRRLRLVPVRPDHLNYLYDLATSEGVGRRWRFGGAVPARREFQQNLYQGVFSQFVCVNRRDGKPFGHLVAYEADFLNGHVHVGGITEERVHLTGYAMEGFILFIRYLFQQWNFRKIYFELPEYNREQIFSRGILEWVVEEARLKDVSYYDGMWWDRSIISISRTFFYANSGLR